MKHIGFFSFGYWTPSPQSQVRSAADALTQTIDLAVAGEALGYSNCAVLPQVRVEGRVKPGHDEWENYASLIRPMLDAPLARIERAQALVDLAAQGAQLLDMGEQRPADFFLILGRQALHFGNGLFERFDHASTISGHPTQDSIP